MKKTSDQRFQYEYSCVFPENCDEACAKKIEEIDKTSCKTLFTNENVLGNELGNAGNFLDRHQITCPANFSLKSFKLERKSPKVRYSFTCCPAKLINCNSTTTKPTPYGIYSTGDFEKQNVKLEKPDQVITGFKLNCNYQKKQWNYKVEFCTIIG